MCTTQSAPLFQVPMALYVFLCEIKLVSKDIVHVVHQPALYTLGGNLFKSAVQGCTNYSRNGHRYPVVVISLDGLVKSRVMHPIMLFSTLAYFVGDDPHCGGEIHSL